MHLNQGAFAQDELQQGLLPNQAAVQVHHARQGFPPNAYNQGFKQQQVRIKGSFKV